ncbi:MAG: ATP-binding cassette domain-containing protein, partial [Candidatus Aminicenantes bacterium]|nr:ATP-binding cassette domain-containing protein [Candidatus Aminicenantes bacterium]
FQVFSGEVHALVGENGAGKSTLMKILSGVYPPDDGAMLLDTHLYQPHDPLEAKQRGVGMIYQELTLAPHLTVEENILLGQEPTTFGLINRKKVRKIVQGALERLGHPEINSETPVSELSISERQIVEIARSLTMGCQALVFDEPTSSLNQYDTEKLFEIIKELKNQGLAIVYISHFLEEVQDVADRVTVLRDGEVMGIRDVRFVRMEDIVRLMVGREVNEMYPHSSRDRGKLVLEIKELAGIVKPESSSLLLHQGEVLGIAGLVGAGRTELLRVIFGLDPVRRGEIKIGAYIGPSSPLKRWLQGVGFLSENRKDEGLTLQMNLADNVTMTNLDQFGRWGLIWPKRQHMAAQKWIERLDIRCQGPTQRVGDISGGNQQKIALARLLECDVDVLLLDEPTRGIDVAAKAKIYQIIDSLTSSGSSSSKPSKAILMTSSYLPELLGVCDRIAVMCRGQLGPARPVSELNEEILMREATGQEGG